MNQILDENLFEKQNFDKMRLLQLGYRLTEFPEERVWMANANVYCKTVNLTKNSDTLQAWNLTFKVQRSEMGKNTFEELFGFIQRNSPNEDFLIETKSPALLAIRRHKNHLDKYFRLKGDLSFRNEKINEILEALTNDSVLIESKNNLIRIRFVFNAPFEDKLFNALDLLDQLVKNKLVK